MSFTVFVDDNSHHQDESERYKEGDYESYSEAIAVCKGIVDQYLIGAHKEGMTASELYESYTSFGDDPFVVPKPARAVYSSWIYAKERCVEICVAN